MTTTPTPAPVPTTAPSSASSAVAGVLFGLAVVLGVVAVVYLALVLSDVPNSTVVCGNSDSSMGECLLASQISRTERIEAWSMGLSLMAGAAASVAAGVVSLVVLRRR
ncbi:hypothetical protein [Nocardioides conyzicola]|uniref:Vitamin K epoxide reductase domain-containing protein n=1 Tax=Nocardioides conyzicola TaxID=1651781 RepID=A0ABP8WXC6_9ACTN